MIVFGECKFCLCIVVLSRYACLTTWGDGDWQVVWIVAGSHINEMLWVDGYIRIGFRKSLLNNHRFL